MAAVILGIVFGAIGRQIEPSKDAILLIEFPGEMLMRMLKCIILPLIISSLTTSLAQLQIRHAEKMGGYTLVYYIIRTSIAIVTGIVLVEYVIHPGNPDPNAKTEQTLREEVSFLHTILDLFRNIVPDNLVEATMVTTITRATRLNVTVSLDNAENEVLVNGTLIKFAVVTREGMNVLGLIVLCIALGAVLSHMGPRAETMTDLFSIMELISMRFVSIIMWYSPIGITSMIAGSILTSDDIVQMARNMGMFCVTVMCGLAIHSLITIPSIYFVMTRRNPFQFIRGLFPALVFAFGCSSSAASLPINFRCLEQNLGIDRRVTRFVLPIGATTNMDGTALYEAVAAIFIAQRAGRIMHLGEIIQVSLAATLGTIGAAAIPGGGMVPILMVVESLGLPTNDIGLIIALDWFMDRLQTTVTVMGDAFGAGIVHHFVNALLSTEERDMDKLVEAARQLEEAQNTQTERQAEEEEEEQKEEEEEKAEQPAEERAAGRNKREASNL